MNINNRKKARADLKDFINKLGNRLTDDEIFTLGELTEAASMSSAMDALYKVWEQASVAEMSIRGQHNRKIISRYREYIENIYNAVGDGSEINDVRFTVYAADSGILSSDDDEEEFFPGGGW